MNDVKQIVVNGGKSGIGLQAVKEFIAVGHRVVVLGSHPSKAKAALLLSGQNLTKSAFYEVDLSTNDGVRDAARSILAKNERIDAILHTAGVMTPGRDIRTKDGLNLVFALGYIARYHLTELLLPALRRAPHPHIVVLTAKVSLAAKVDTSPFPEFPHFDYWTSGKSLLRRASRKNGAWLFDRCRKCRRRQDGHPSLQPLVDKSIGCDHRASLL